MYRIRNFPLSHHFFFVTDASGHIRKATWKLILDMDSGAQLLWPRSWHSVESWVWPGCWTCSLGQVPGCSSLPCLLETFDSTSQISGKEGSFHAHVSCSHILSYCILRTSPTVMSMSAHRRQENLMFPCSEFKLKPRTVQFHSLTPEPISLQGHPTISRHEILFSQTKWI